MFAAGVVDLKSHHFCKKNREFLFALIFLDKRVAQTYWEIKLLYGNHKIGLVGVAFKKTVVPISNHVL